MKRAILGILISVGLASCAGSPRPHTSTVQSSAISLEAASDLLLQKKVASLFQPHSGNVKMTLKDGRTVEFAQPRLDWVTNFVREHGLQDEVSILVE